VDESVVDRLIPALLRSLEVQCGGRDARSSDLGRIVSKQHALRLIDLIKEVEEAAAKGDEETKILAGGSTTCDASTGFIAPTIVLHPPANSRMMQEEIFGPILPIVTVKSRTEAIDYMRNMPGTPLCLYVFTRSDAIFEEICRACPTGGLMRNDAIMHLSSADLPFGGLGSSGFGRYHGKYTFDTFSHEQPAMFRPCAPGLDFYMARYHPYTNKIKAFLCTKVLVQLPSVPVLHLRLWGVLFLGAAAFAYVPALASRQAAAAEKVAAGLEWLALRLRNSVCPATK
jgi:delta 1-pyrroline-5-carboxylate dehydrogenase